MIELVHDFINTSRNKRVKNKIWKNNSRKSN